MILDPLFPYYGSCHSMAPKYPRPRYNRVIEPFAGSSCYSLHHWQRDVVLVERDPVIAELWRYLLRVSPAEVLALPDLEPEQSTDDLEVEPAARSLIGLWANQGNSYPCKKKSSWAAVVDARRRQQRLTWDARARARIARQLEAIRHWTIVEGDYAEATDHRGSSAPWLERATWFIDPPYIGRPGSHYRYGSKGIDYTELAAWARTLEGQVMVREQFGATWLPFEGLGTVHGQRGKSTEVAWFSCEQDRPSFRQPELFT